MTIEKTTIADKSINTNEFFDLSNGILDNLVNSETSPFVTVLDNFKQYLDVVPDDQLDSTQKVSAYADLLKSVYMQINEKAISAAIEILKFNSEVELQRVKTEMDVYNSEVTAQKIIEDTALTTASTNAKNKDIQLVEAQITAANLGALKLRAELVKQWGVQDVITYSFGSAKYSPVTNNATGSTLYYRVTDNGSFLKGQQYCVGAEVYGTTVTTTPLTNGELFKETGTMATSISNTTKPGIIDKQVLGYDLVTLKDILKTCDERAALLANAKISESEEELAFRASLINAIKNAVTETNTIIDLVQ